MKRPSGKPVHIRRPDAKEDETITLMPSDFTFLKKVTEGSVQIKHDEKNYRRMLTMKLVTHRFDQSQGWPIAFAVLTAEGRQAIAQEYS